MYKKPGTEVLWDGVEETTMVCALADGADYKMICCWFVCDKTGGSSIIFFLGTRSKVER